jgi:hypothetical protein
MQKPSEIKWSIYPTSDFKPNSFIYEEWDRLNERTTNQGFLSAAAISCYLKYFGRNREHVAVGVACGKIKCMTVIVKVDPFRWETFQPSQLPLGAFLLSSDAEIRSTAKSLLNALPSFPLVLSATQIDSRFYPRPVEDSVTQFSDYIQTGWIELSESFEHYWNKLSKNLRKNLKRQLNKVSQVYPTFSFRKITEKNEMRTAVKRYGELESSGWKAGAGTAVHIENNQGRFYAELMTTLSVSGNALIYEYWIDETLAASNLCLLANNELIVLKTAYNEKFTDVSPAFLLRLDQIKHAYESKEFYRLDFYGKKRDWQTQWTEKFRDIYHMTSYRLPLIKILASIFRQRNNTIK